MIVRIARVDEIRPGEKVEKVCVWLPKKPKWHYRHSSMSMVGAGMFWYEAFSGEERSWGGV